MRLNRLNETDKDVRLGKGGCIENEEDIYKQVPQIPGSEAVLQ